MFDYAHKLQLAASDMGRRVGLKAVAGLLALIAAGFLIAALWTFLADTLDWGPLAASLLVAALFGAIAGVLLAVSNKVKHPVPSTDELKREVEARASLATDAALNRAKEKACEVVGIAENKVQGLMDTAGFKAASLVDDAEARVQRFTNTTVSNAIHKVGLDSGVAGEVKGAMQDIRTSRAGPAAGVLSAFAIGLVLAKTLLPRQQAWEDEDWDDDDWDDVWTEDGYFDDDYPGA